MKSNKTVGYSRLFWMLSFDHSKRPSSLFALIIPLETLYPRATYVESNEV